MAERCDRRDQKSDHGGGSDETVAVPERPLPSGIPLFSLSGVLLLPRGRLPLHIFEPRYIAMVDEALAGDRMIGMIQPVSPESTDEDPVLYGTGCAGRISSFRELEGGRYLITLTGVSRFRVLAKTPTEKGFSRAAVSWDDFSADLSSENAVAVDRCRLLAALPDFLIGHGLVVNAETIRDAPDERLVTALAMVCPFPPQEQQALLEAVSLEERARLLTILIEMAILQPQGGQRSACH